MMGQAPARHEYALERNTHRHTYTEVEFFACQLVNGSPRQIYVDSVFYWPTVDEWFQRQWPDRWTTNADLQAQAATVPKVGLWEGQMEFKLQFYEWSRTQVKPHELYGTSNPRYSAVRQGDFSRVFVGPESHPTKHK